MFTQSILQKLHNLSAPRTLGVLLCFFSFNAYAQDVSSEAQQEEPAVSDATDTQTAPVLEEVFVTARKRVEPLQISPVSATVLRGQVFQMLFLNDLKTLNFPAPNVNISQNDMFSNTATISIRGMISVDVESTLEPPVGIFLDGVYIPRVAASSLDLFDVEQIEILRGPQGTIFGRNTTAGAIQVRSRRPSGEFGVRGSVTIGEFGRLDLKAAMDIPISEGKVDAKFAVLSQTMDGYYTNIADRDLSTNATTGRDLGNEDIIAFRPMIRFTPNDSFDLTFIGEYHRNKSDLMPGQNYSPDKLLCILQSSFCGVPFGEVDEFEVAMTDLGAGIIDAKIWSITADMNWDVGPGTITWISNYRDTDEFIDIDGEMTVSDFFRVSRDQPHKQYSSELRFASSAWENFDFIGGVYFFHQEYTMEQNFFIGIGPPNTPVSHFIATPRQEHDSYSVFAEGNYHVNEKLTVTLGGRWSKDKKDFYSEGLGFFPTPGPSFDIPSKSWDDFGPKAGIRYQWTPDLMTYFTYTRGFKSGGYNGRCGNLATCETSFDPESVDGFEVGLKADFLDNTVRTNLALFWNEFDDLQRTNIVPFPGSPNGNETVTENAASARIRGVELEVSALLPVEGLQFDLGVGYLDASYSEFCVDLDGSESSMQVPVSECGGVFSLGDLDNDGVEEYLVETDISNLSFQRAPEWNVTTSLTYEFPAGNVGNIILNGRYTYTDELFTDALELSPRSSTNLVDASISFVDAEGRYRVSLYGLNLTDEVYVAARNLAANLWSTRFVNPPRRWGIEVSFEY